MAQKEPSLVQNNLLASRLVSSNSDLLEAARPNSKLYNIAKYQLYKIARMIPEFQLYNTAIPRPNRLDRSDLIPRPDGPDGLNFRPRPNEPDRSETSPELSETVLYNTVKTNTQSPLGARG